MVHFEESIGNEPSHLIMVAARSAVTFSLSRQRRMGWTSARVQKKDNEKGGYRNNQSIYVEIVGDAQQQVFFAQDDALPVNIADQAIIK